MKLKKLYSSREVAQLTGLTARQLQWWAQSRFFPPTVPSHKTEAGGFTERRYTPIELLELMVLADLRRKGFTVARIRKLLQVLKTRFKTRLYEAIEGGGPVTLYIDGENIFAKNEAGRSVQHPRQRRAAVDDDGRRYQAPPAHCARTTGASTRRRVRLAPKNPVRRSPDGSGIHCGRGTENGQSATRSAWSRPAGWSA